MPPADHAAPPSTSPRSVPPHLSPEAVAQAREQALAARRARAEVKRQLRAGAVGPGEILDLAFAGSELGRAVARMTVGDLLLSLPGTGPVQADRTLVRLGISGNRRLRALGEHQRAALRATWRGGDGARS